MPAPYGYRRVQEELKNGERKPSGQIEVYEPEAKWVRRVFQWYTEDGLPLNEVLRKLVEHGAPNRGGRTAAGGKGQRWYTETVQRMLKNETYVGVWSWNKTEAIVPDNPRSNSEFAKDLKTSHRPRDESEWVTVSVPAIIERDVWEAAQARIEHNKAMLKRNCRHDYLLRGYVLCELCGRRMCARGRTYRGVFYYTYACTGKAGHHLAGGGERCPSANVSGPLLDEAVWGVVERVITDPAELMALAKYSEDEEGQTAEIEEAKANFADQLAALDKREKRLLALYETGDYDLELYRERRAAIQDEKTSVKRRLAEVRKRELSRMLRRATPEDVQGLVDVARSRIPTLSLAEKRKVLDTLTLFILAGKERVIIEGLVTDRLTKVFSTFATTATVRTTRSAARGRDRVRGWTEMELNSLWKENSEGKWEEVRDEREDYCAIEKSESSCVGMLTRFSWDNSLV